MIRLLVGHGALSYNGRSLLTVLSRGSAARVYRRYSWCSPPVNGCSHISALSWNTAALWLKMAARNTVLSLQTAAQLGGYSRCSRLLGSTLTALTIVPAAHNLRCTLMVRLIFIPGTLLGLGCSLGTVLSCASAAHLSRHTFFKWLLYSFGALSTDGCSLLTVLCPTTAAPLDSGALYLRGCSCETALSWSAAAHP